MNVKELCAEAERTCKTCGVTALTSEFIYGDHARRRCKSCMREASRKRYRADPEKHKAAIKIAEAKNPTLYAVLRKKYRSQPHIKKRDKEYLRKYAPGYRERNLAKLRKYGRERMAAWRTAHPEEAIRQWNESWARWSERNGGAYWKKWGEVSMDTPTSIDKSWHEIIADANALDPLSLLIEQEGDSRMGEMDLLEWVSREMSEDEWAVLMRFIECNGDQNVAADKMGKPVSEINEVMASIRAKAHALICSEGFA